MVNIPQKQKVDQGNSGFLGDLGKLISAVSPAVGVINPAVGAGMAAIGGINQLSSQAPSVSQTPQVQTNAGAMQRKLQQFAAPAPIQTPQAPQGIDPFQRRLLGGGY